MKLRKLFYCYIRLKILFVVHVKDLYHISHHIMASSQHKCIWGNWIGIIWHDVKVGSVEIFFRSAQDQCFPYSIYVYINLYTCSQCCKNPFTVPRTWEVTISTGLVVWHNLTQNGELLAPQSWLFSCNGTDWRVLLTPLRFAKNYYFELINN